MGAAGVFLLAAVAGVVGNKLTGHLTMALVVFVVLLVGGMAVTFLLERHADSRISPEGQDVGGARGANNLRGARGVQIGDGNRQVNHFGGTPEPGPDHRA